VARACIVIGNSLSRSVIRAVLCFLLVVGWFVEAEGSA